MVRACIWSLLMLIILTEEANENAKGAETEGEDVPGQDDGEEDEGGSEGMSNSPVEQWGFSTMG